MNTRHLLLLLLTLFLAACGGANDNGDANDDDTAAAPTDSASRTPRPTSTPAAPIDDEEAVALLYDLSGSDANAVQAAINRVIAARDQRFVAPLIELAVAARLGLVAAPADVILIGLEMLSGESPGSSVYDWILWYGGSDLTPPPGFTTWKGRLMAEIDPNFADFLKDEYPSNIRVEEILWGGVVVDGIPALDNPHMLEADKATYLEPDEPVFGLALNGDARAYPLRILDWHEMANDVVGGVPVSLAYCTLCGAAIAYAGEASDGVTYTFGSSGFLYRSNKLMYDRQTRTLWNQLTGEPVLGELVGTGVALEILPVVLTTWREWQNDHPDTQVVDVDTGFDRVYQPGAAYGDYFASDNTMFPVWLTDDTLGTKEQIFALRVNGVPKAYPLAFLAQTPVVNDTVGGANVVIVGGAELVEVVGQSLRAGPVAYDAGSAVRAYERGEYSFSLDADGATLVDRTGRSWTVTEDALVAADGEELARLGGHLAYWFGWYAFFPNTEVYVVEE